MLSQMTVQKWHAALEANAVLVMTPQSLVNMLKAGVVKINKISLLVARSSVNLLLQFHSRCYLEWLSVCKDISIRFVKLYGLQHVGELQAVWHMFCAESCCCTRTQVTTMSQLEES